MAETLLNRQRLKCTTLCGKYAGLKMVERGDETRLHTVDVKTFIETVEGFIETSIVY